MFQVGFLDMCSTYLPDCKCELARTNVKTIALTKLMSIIYYHYILMRYKLGQPNSKYQNSVLLSCDVLKTTIGCRNF